MGKYSAEVAKFRAAGGLDKPKRNPRQLLRSMTDDDVYKEADRQVGNKPREPLDLVSGSLAGRKKSAQSMLSQGYDPETGEPVSPKQARRIRKLMRDARYWNTEGVPTL